MRQLIREAFTKFGYEVSKTKTGPTSFSTRYSDKAERRNRFEPYSVDFLGHTLHVHDQASFNLGLDELFDKEMYKFHATTNAPYIIDCGANMGMSVIYFKQLYPTAQIAAFEADPHIFSFLDKNVVSFNLSNVTVFNKAVWNSSNEKLSFLSEGGAGGRLQQNKKEKHKFVEVDTIRLKDYLDRPVDFLKIDIEGAEFEVLKDCAENLKNVKNLFVEYHSFPDSPQRLHLILDFVEKAGFRYHIKDAFTSPLPFMETQLNFGMDLLLNVFCYRA